MRCWVKAPCRDRTLNRAAATCVCASDGAHVLMRHAGIRDHPKHNQPAAPNFGSQTASTLTDCFISRAVAGRKMMDDDGCVRGEGG